MSLLDPLGRRTAARWREIGSIGVMPYLALKGAVLERGRGRRMVIQTTAAQVYFAGIQPLGAFALVALVVGFVFVVVADNLLRSAGMDDRVASVVVVGISRELVPILVAMVLIGRSGGAITTELGYMRVNREIDAISIAGMNVDYVVVLPRFLGLVVASFGLVTIMSAVAILGGYFAASLLGFIAIAFQLRNLLDAFTMDMLAIAWLKAVLFGGVVSAGSCFHGLAVEGAYTEIPRANANATMFCLVACFAFNALLSVASI
jgi:phospholipid/cholesterol/gamma-HCH transport system permease protein